jgi:hypothetical protein
MIQAELHGKIPSKFEHAEDILTSNVFGVINYCERSIVLNEFLKSLNICVSSSELDKAEFKFWPRNSIAEPDVVITLPSTYILVEAKYNSKLGSDLTQLPREIRYAKAEANKRDLYLLCVTDDILEPKETIARVIQKTGLTNVKWVGWRQITTIFKNSLKNEEIDVISKRIVTEVIQLLEKKNLINFESFNKKDYQDIIKLTKIQGPFYRTIELFARNLLVELSKYGITIEHKKKDSDKPIIRDGCSKAMFASQNWITTFINLPLWNNKWGKKDNGMWNHAYLFVEFTFDEYKKSEYKASIGYFYCYKDVGINKSDLSKLLNRIYDQKDIYFALHTKDEALSIIEKKNFNKLDEIHNQVNNAHSIEIWKEVDIEKLDIEIAVKYLLDMRDIVDKFDFLRRIK